jgi:hypothetical protein
MHYQRFIKYGFTGSAEPLDTSGPNNPNWKGGRVRGGEKGNYWLIHSPSHPNASTVGYVLEHRLVMEVVLGRLLDRDEVVHHVNEDPLDNRPENLRVTTQPNHARDHAIERGRDALGRFPKKVKGKT